MAAGTATNPEAPPVQLSFHDQQFVEQQLRAAGVQVKLFDLGMALLLLAIGVLVFFLVAAVIDHWLLPLGFWGRLLALGLAIGGIGYWAATRLIPLLYGTINPLYAAHTIEASRPGLKNSLINFLLLRRDSQALHPRVFEAVGRQAAADLTQVPVDQVIDRRPLLQLAVVLGGLLTLFAIYKLLSPKDPFPTVARVLAPWADIAPPTRCVITSIEPGDIEIYRGRTFTVSAVGERMRDADRLAVYYSTADRRIVDLRVPMQPTEEGVKHVAELPEASGMEQDITYHVRIENEYGTRTYARSRDFHATVLPAPDIVVQRVEYEYPPYSRLAPRAVEGSGEIEAIEGTRVVLHARANQLLRSAYLEFTSEGRPAESRETLPMEVNDSSARARFTLLREEGRAKHNRYRVRMIAVDGARNEQPVLYTINVLPDLPPVVEMIAPSESRTELAINSRLRVEVRANDPDFELSHVRLHASHNGLPLLEQELAGSATLRTFDFSPRRLELRPGDTLLLWATAADNRTAPVSRQPQPNVSSTSKYTIHITGSAAGDSAEPDPNAGSEEGESGSEQAGGGKDPAGEGAAQSGMSESENSDSEPEMGGDSQKQGGEEEAGSESSQGGSNGVQGEADTPADENAQAGGGDGQASSGGSSADGQAGEQAGGKSSSSQGNGGGKNNAGEGAPSDSSSEGKPEAGATQGGPPQRIDPEAQPGDAIEEILKHYEQQQGGHSPSVGAPQGSGGDSAGASGAGNDGPRPEGEQGTEPGSPTDQPGSGDSRPNSTSDPQAGSPQGSPSSAAPRAGEPGARPGTEPGPTPPEGTPPNGGMPPSGEGSDPSSGPGGEQPSRGTPGGEPGSEQIARPMDMSGEGENPGSPGQGDNGPSEAGSPNEQAGGSPESQGDQRQSPKDGSAGEETGAQGSEAQSPSTSNRQSDSQGGSDGSQSGGGSQGGGQSARQPGQDSAGGSTPSEEGAGTAQESGSGDTSSHAGGSRPADGATGSSGVDRGAGESSRSGGGEQGGPAGNRSGGDDHGTADGGSNSADPQAAPSEGTGGSAGGGLSQAEGGVDRREAGQRGGEGRGTGEGSLPPSGEAAVGDAANEAYLREATDLAIEHLKHADDSLLEQLGWSEEDRRRFIEGYEQMRRAASRQGAEGDQAKKELNDWRKGLGLSPPAERLHESTAPSSDRGPTLENQGFRSEPPPAYQKLYRAFRKGRPASGE